MQPNLMTGPAVSYVHGVLDQAPSRSFIGESNKSLRALAPDSGLPTLCLLNGEYVLPEDLDWVPSNTDIVVFCTVPMGGNGNASQSLIGIVMIAAGVYMDNPGLIIQGLAMLAGSLIGVPTVATMVQQNQETASPTYNIQLSGNSARLGQAIPVPYGRHILMPDFAAQPYSEYDGAGDQYYYALLCLGQVDKFTVESIMIDDTDLSHFEDVEKQFIGPNFATTLSLVDPAVVNAPEVASNELKFGEYVGPFAACGPGLKARFIGIDIFAPKGLFFAAADGTLTSKTGSCFVEARKINDNGTVAGIWTLLGTISITDSTNRAIRVSRKFAVTPARYEVRLTRLEPEDTNNRAGHALQWGGMRAYLTIDEPLEPTATFLALKIRATSQLSGLSQRKISIIIKRWLAKWDPTLGWQDPVESNSIAWAIADVLKNPVYGANVPDSRIDLQTLYDLQELWTHRNDVFNGVFDKRITVWQAITIIARAGRARPVMRGSVFTFVRDGEQELPVALFNMRNIVRGSFNISYSMVDDDTPDGVEIQYFDEKVWASKYIRMPIPGVIESLTPSAASLQGITSENQAKREAAYIAADSAYRRTYISFETEMEGYLPAFGDLIAVAHDMTNLIYSGDVVNREGSKLTCSENLDWSIGDNYAILTDLMGDVHGPYKVKAGPLPNTMIFLDPIDISIRTSLDAERTKYSMGPANSYARLCKITGIHPGDGNIIKISCVVEDNRVHLADKDFFDVGFGPGGPGDVPVTGRAVRCVYAPDGLAPYGAASDAERNKYGYYADEDLTVGADPGYQYDN